ncbi:sce7726 family protein [Actinomyces sp.]|uniref:sce7726 family protein n=1 Tax=Actinomycetes TaxID=1760 RepID=UPI0029031947|nr:sce7726 family protein [Actinomyces sp.]MDU1431567.1 sce7726 family protein [Actinomyces sp.]
MDLDKNEAAALSRLFSAAVLRDFSKYARSPLFARLLFHTRLSAFVPSEATVGTAFNQAFELLSKSKFRDDYVYRTAITEKILLGRHNLNTATLLSEVRAGSCKADVVVLNGTSTAYEIKSERDSLSRLRNQLENYRQVFAAVNVVVSKSHLPEVLRITPEDVGIVTLSERYRFQTTRDPQNKPERVNPMMILDILRIDEATSILSRLGREVPDVPNTKIRSELQRIFATLEPTVVHEETVKTLKASRSQASLASFISSVPASVRAASLAVNPTPSNRVRIKEAVDTPLATALAWR